MRCLKCCDQSRLLVFLEQTAILQRIQDLIRGFMGQVPTHHYLLIGSGALAKHFHFYLSSTLTPNKLSTWNRRDDSIEDLKSKLSAATHVLLAISDRSLEDFYKKYSAWATQSRWVHFSGALHIEGLISAHPLMSFGPDLYSLDHYQNLHFALTGAGSLKEVFPMWINSFTVLAAEKKALYHSLCVLGGTLPILLWEKMSSGLVEMGLPRNAGDIYLQTILENYLSHRGQALTGPLPRKDLITIRKNLASLENDSFQKIYSAFAESQNIDLGEV